MMPHASMGIRVRGCRFRPLYTGEPEGKGSPPGVQMSILSMLARGGMLSPQKIPFYRKLCTQGRRG